ncbi:hypothetical protein B7463_g3306, partial [Scytalidium lignicola]
MQSSSSLIEPRPEGEKCGISDLPNEVLCEIFFYICSTYNCAFSRCSDHLSITLVCRRWRENSERSLFRAIKFSIYGPREVEQSRRLLSIIESRPNIATYLQDIQIFPEYLQEDMIPNLVPVLQRCVQLRCVGLSLKLSDAAAALIQATKSLPLLERLILSISNPGNPTLPVVLELMTSLPSLRRLKLLNCDACEPYDRQELLSRRARPSTISQKRLESLLPPSRYRTGNLSSLEIKRIEIPPYVMEHLLRWPTALVKISLRGFHGTVGYTNDELRRLLSMHQDSLRCIQLQINRTLDFTSFPNLEELRISWYIMRREAPSNTIENLPLANLRFLRLDVLEHDLAFTKDDVKWMDQFASALGTRYPHSTLKRVGIRFLFKFIMSRDCLPYDRQLDVWPCEYAEEASQCMNRHGIKLEYEPFWTRDEWDEFIGNKWCECEPGPCELGWATWEGSKGLSDVRGEIS